MPINIPGPILGISDMVGKNFHLNMTYIPERVIHKHNISKVIKEHIRWWKGSEENWSRIRRSVYRFAILHFMVRAGHIEKVIFEQRHERGERLSFVSIWWKDFPKKGLEEQLPEQWEGDKRLIWEVRDRGYSLM